jgi:hypothetical protein
MTKLLRILDDAQDLLLPLIGFETRKCREPSITKKIAKFTEVQKALYNASIELIVFDRDYRIGTDFMTNQPIYKQNKEYECDKK